MNVIVNCQIVEIYYCKLQQRKKLLKTQMSLLLHFITKKSIKDFLIADALQSLTFFQC
jgi:hypothetical protein